MSGFTWYWHQRLKSGQFRALPELHGISNVCDSSQNGQFPSIARAFWAPNLPLLAFDPNRLDPTLRLFEEGPKNIQVQICFHWYCIGFIRLNLFEDGVHAVHWFSYFGLVYVGVYLILMIYTAYHFISHGEFTKFLPCTCLFCPIGAVSSHTNLYLSTTIWYVTNFHEFQYAPYIWTVVSQNRKRYHSLVEFGGRTSIVTIMRKRNTIVYAPRQWESP